MTEVGQKKKSYPITLKQKEMMVNFIQARPEMYTGKLSPTYTVAKMRSLWGELTTILNSIPEGPAKEWHQWRKTWVDLKKNCKAKLAQETRYSGGTGGGPPLTSPKELSSIEEKMLSIISPITIGGDQHIEESEVIFDFDGTDISIRNDDEEMPTLPKSIQEDNDELIMKNREPLKEIRIEEHDYVKHTAPMQVTTPKSENREPIKRKKITKTSRLTDSIKNSRMYLELTKAQSLADQQYKKKKLELLERACEAKENYYREKLRLLKKIADNGTPVETQLI